MVIATRSSQVEKKNYIDAIYGQHVEKHYILPKNNVVLNITQQVQIREHHAQYISG